MHPLGADAPKEDFVGLAFGSLAFSAALGLGLNSSVTFVVRTLQANAPPDQKIDLGGGPAVFLLAGTLLSCFASALATWRLMAPAKNPYRQGMLAMVSFFASFVISILTIPVDRLGGRGGLAGLALAGFVAVVLLGRRLAARSA